MLRATSTCAYKAAKLAAPGSAVLLRSVASQAGRHPTAIGTSLLSQSSLPFGVTITDCASKLPRGSFAAGPIGAYRCSTGVSSQLPSLLNHLTNSCPGPFHEILASNTLGVPCSGLLLLATITVVTHADFDVCTA